MNLPLGQRSSWQHKSRFLRRDDPRYKEAFGLLTL